MPSLDPIILHRFVTRRQLIDVKLRNYLNTCRWYHVMWPWLYLMDREVISFCVHINDDWKNCFNLLVFLNRCTLWNWDASLFFQVKPTIHTIILYENNGSQAEVYHSGSAFTLLCWCECFFFVLLMFLIYKWQFLFLKFDYT